MFDLTKFTPTRKVEFEQLARDRKDDFEALRAKGRWTASVYVGSNNLYDWLFNPNDGVMTWLGL
jgi:hypothetical protein